MLGRGRGEILNEIDLENLDYGQEDVANFDYKLDVISPDNISVSTADAYGGVKPSIPQMRIMEILVLPLEEWHKYLYNDFELSVFLKYPELDKIKSALYRDGAVFASMSGSGSSVFFITRCNKNK